MRRPKTHTPNTPITALWAQYQSLAIRAEKAAHEEFAPLYDQMQNIEGVLTSLPCTTMQDVAAKFLMLTSFGDEDVLEYAKDEFKAEMTAIAGGQE